MSEILQPRIERQKFYIIGPRAQIRMISHKKNLPTLEYSKLRFEQFNNKLITYVQIDCVIDEINSRVDEAQFFGKFCGIEPILKFLKNILVHALRRRLHHLLLNHRSPLVRRSRRIQKSYSKGKRQEDQQF